MNNENASRLLKQWFLRLNPRRSEKLGQRRAELDKVDGLGDVVVEPGLGALLLDIRHDVSRERDDGHRVEVLRLLPGSNLPAGLVAILARHV